MRFRTGILTFLFTTLTAAGARGQQPPPPEMPPAEPPPAEMQPPPQEMPPLTPVPPPMLAAPPPAAAPAADKFTVTGYGLVTTNIIYLDGPVNNEDPPMWAAAPPAGYPGDDGSLVFSARQSRFGLKAGLKNPPGILHATEITGVVEADFFGGILDQGRSFTFSVPRLRLASGTIMWGPELKITVGQDWSVMTPVNPDSMLHLGVPGMSATGNLWARLPQVRVEGTMPGEWGIAWAIALVANEVAGTGLVGFPVPAAGATQPPPITVNHTDNVAPPTGAFQVAGEQSSIPAIEARIGLAGKMAGKPMSVGVSGHMGRRRFSRTLNDTNARAFGLDWVLPFTEMITVKGEFFYGEGLDGFFGGIDQGVVAATNMAGTAVTGLNEVTSFGGWAQAIIKPTKEWMVSLGAGVDHPKATDILATMRQLNLGVYGAIAYELAKGFTVGVEYDYLQTDLKNNPPTAPGALGTSYKRSVLAINGALAF